MPLNLHFATASTLRDALRSKQVSAHELTQHAIARIERHDGAINAICVRDFERALEAARAADQALARGEAAPLLGLPITIKESFNVAGLRTTWGFVTQRDFIAAEDALAVERIRAAGAIILGKTNVPVALGDWQSYNPIYGTTNNPFDLGRTPGGSSGGSAAALAAGFGALSLGSDIGGSLRAPAHYCGVYAHKPTYALCPARGHIPPPFPPLPFERDLAVIGPMARSAADLALLFDVIAGPDPIDSGIGYQLALPAPRRDTLNGARVLLLDNHPLLPTSAVVQGALASLGATLRRAGASVAHDSALLPDLAANARLYMRLLLSFFGANFPPEIYAGACAAAARLDAADRSLVAERLRGIALTHREWIEADAQRAALRARWRELFKQFDAVICPVMPTTAFVHDQSEPQEARQLSIDGAVVPYADQLVWPGIATLPGLPATALPVAQSPDGLPIGVQLIGPWLEDRTPLRLAELIEREIGGFKPPPAFAD